MSSGSANKQIVLECANCNTQTPLVGFKGACPNCGETIVEARYELDKISPEIFSKQLRDRKKNLWRYHEFLPIQDTSRIVSMGEGATPLLKSRVLAANLGLKNLYIKDERQGPTGSFKDRQASVAISALCEMGVEEVVVASTGNVAIAYAAYAARAGIKLWAFFPALAPNDKMREAAVYGAEVIKTTGSYDQTKQLAASFARTKGIFLDRGIKNVAAIEAMKTISYEIAEQLGEELEDGQRWRAPDWYLQGVSGGMGPIGVGKGFRELMNFGLVDKMPALGNVQSSGCAPMVAAFQRNQRVATPVEDPTTIIATLATGNPGLAYQILYDYTQEHGGYFVDTGDEEAFNALRILARTEGISVEPATGATFAGLFKMVQRGIIKPDDVVVINCSGHTLPVEKQVLGEQWQELVDLSEADTTPPVPTEGLVSAVEQMPGKLKRVVVIEDNEASARLMSRLLEAHDNCEVHQAHNGASGIVLARSIKPDLVITDLMMPEVDGFSVIDTLRADPDLRDLPIVVVTAKELSVQEREFLDTHADLLLQKGSFIDEEFIEDLVNKLS